MQYLVARNTEQNDQLRALVMRTRHLSTQLVGAPPPYDRPDTGPSIQSAPSGATPQIQQMERAQSETRYLVEELQQSIIWMEQIFGVEPAPVTPNANASKY